MWTLKDYAKQHGIKYRAAWNRYKRGLISEAILEVINKVDGDKEDLLQDFVSLVTSFTARLYGLRRSRRKTEQLIKELSEKEE